MYLILSILYYTSIVKCIKWPTCESYHECIFVMITSFHSYHVAKEYFTFVVTWPIPSCCFLPPVVSFWHNTKLLVLMKTFFTTKIYKPLPPILSLYTFKIYDTNKESSIIIRLNMTKWNLMTTWSPWCLIWVQETQQKRNKTDMSIVYKCWRLGAHVMKVNVHWKA